MLVEIKLNREEVELNNDVQEQDNQMWLSLPGSSIKELPDGGQLFKLEMSTKQILMICRVVEKYSAALKVLQSILNSALKSVMKEWLMEDGAKQLVKELDELFAKF